MVQKDLSSIRTEKNGATEINLWDDQEKDGTEGSVKHKKKMVQRK
jgi:hypothetical protein